MTGFARPNDSGRLLGDFDRVLRRLEELARELPPCDLPRAAALLRGLALELECRAIRETVELAAAKAAPTRERPPPARLLTAKELARRLGLSETAIRHAKAIPRHKIGRAVRYDLEEVLRWSRAGLEEEDLAGREQA